MKVGIKLILQTKNLVQTTNECNANNGLRTLSGAQLF